MWRPISLVPELAEHAAECQLISELSVKLCFQFPDETCVPRTVCALLLEARFPQCNCWKAKPVEMGRDAASKGDETTILGHA
jgi:hypothetical protein